MSNDNLRAAITAALKRRDLSADLDVSTTCTPLGAWGSLAGGVIRGPDGALIDVVARASDDAKALRGVAFACGLREDGGDPAEEVERLRAELAETERRLDAEISAMDARDGAYHALDGARDGSDDLVALAECRMAEIGRLRTDNARLDDVARGALDDLARVRAELDAARAALDRAHHAVLTHGPRCSHPECDALAPLRCDDCGRRFCDEHDDGLAGHDPGFGPQAHAVGPDDLMAGAAMRAAGGDR